MQAEATKSESVYQFSTDLKTQVVHMWVAYCHLSCRSHFYQYFYGPFVQLFAFSPFIQLFALYISSPFIQLFALYISLPFIQLFALYISPFTSFHAVASMYKHVLFCLAFSPSHKSRFHLSWRKPWILKPTLNHQGFLKNKLHSSLLNSCQSMKLSWRD